MIALREDQVKQKLDAVLNTVGNELAQLKSQYMLPETNDPNNIFQRKYYYDILRPITIGSKLSSAEIQNRIRTAFNAAGLKDMNFEYAMVVGSLRNSTFATIEKQSANYIEAQADTIRNYTKPFLILSPSGSPSENLTNDEVLFLVSLNWKDYVMKSLTWNIIMAIFFTVIILAAFYVTVYTMLKQKKLADIKNDFINNMTHEFKTPIATISLAVDALKNEKVIASREKMNYFSGIIKEENLRMNRQVETILKASQLEKQEVDIEKSPISVHQIIHHVVDNFSLQLQEKHGHTILNLDAENDNIFGDEVHFSNLVNNLVDNAVKYSKENTPIQLRISTLNNNEKLMLKFEDNGIGMSKETQKRVFEKFYRAHTGNLHNVKGFGLGLSYVKSVTLSHNGSIKVESAVGKGSTFTLDFPVINVN